MLIAICKISYKFPNKKFHMNCSCITFLFQPHLISNIVRSCFNDCIYLYLGLKPILFAMEQLKHRFCQNFTRYVIAKVQVQSTWKSANFMLQVLQQILSNSLPIQFIYKKE